MKWNNPPRFLDIRCLQDQLNNSTNANIVQVLGDVNNAMTVTEDIELACKDLPIPMRFESFEMEVLLWVEREGGAVRGECRAVASR